MPPHGMCAEAEGEGGRPMTRQMRKGAGPIASGGHASLPGGSPLLCEVERENSSRAAADFIPEIDDNEPSSDCLFLEIAVTDDGASAFAELGVSTEQYSFAHVEAYILMPAKEYSAMESTPARTEFCDQLLGWGTTDSYSVSGASFSVSSWGISMSLLLDFPAQSAFQPCSGFLAQKKLPLPGAPQGFLYSGCAKDARPEGLRTLPGGLRGTAAAAAAARVAGASSSGGGGVVHLQWRWQQRRPRRARGGLSRVEAAATVSRWEAGGGYPTQRALTATANEEGRRRPLLLLRSLFLLRWTGQEERRSSQDSCPGPSNLAQPSEFEVEEEGENPIPDTVPNSDEDSSPPLEIDAPPEHGIRWSTGVQPAPHFADDGCWEFLVGRITALIDSTDPAPIEVIRETLEQHTGSAFGMGVQQEHWMNFINDVWNRVYTRQVKMTWARRIEALESDTDAGDLQVTEVRKRRKTRELRMAARERSIARLDCEFGEARSSQDQDARNEIEDSEEGGLYVRDGNDSRRSRSSTVKKAERLQKKTPSCLCFSA
ncbi:hypothetical protein Taro_007606 [Colocasia esculenta]|uniref:Uncharacterized protein n=1 Tax=Colocasia esculenta TaxID=4460 RepID=A0A843TYR0_COLES|nr:hypothetical protein [Colocasia esculenta]